MILYSLTLGSLRDGSEISFLQRNIYFKKSIEEINTLPPSELFGFRPCKMSDYYGISETQGPTWIRPYTLMDYALPGWTFVVGHTTAREGIFDLHDAYIEEFGEEMSEEAKEKVPHVWLCDALPKEYLIIENGEFKPTKI